MSVQPGDAWRIVAPRNGGPDVLMRESISLADPGHGEARLRITAIGVNFIDVYHRNGLYPLNFPTGIGVEAAGVIEAIGGGVEGLRVGQRVGWLPTGPSAYATHAIAKADRLIPLPDGIDDATAAAILLKGVTTWMLAERCAKVAPGQSVLIHAAAGGVGSLAVQWVTAVGARAIAHAGNDAKAAKARSLGAEQAFSCTFEELAGEVRAATGGRGVDAVFDGVGKASWAASLGALAKRGLMISYGNASGPVPPVAPLELGRAGSLFLTRPTMYDYIDTPEARAEAAERLFTMVADGHLAVEIGQRFALADAAEAHRALEARATTGSTILLP